MDVDGTGKIDIDEIFMSNKIPETEWGKRVFKAIDIDGSGCLSLSSSLDCVPFPPSVQPSIASWMHLASDSKAAAL